MVHTSRHRTEKPGSSKAAQSWHCTYKEGIRSVHAQVDELVEVPGNRGVSNTAIQIRSGLLSIHWEADLLFFASFSLFGILSPVAV